jgi:undecaprenyl-diphosphatase
MDIAILLKAFVLGIVEGLTEFLPISSTGHLILAGATLGFDHPNKDVFYVAIQTGAMLAVLWEYRARFFKVDVEFYRNLAVAFIPAAVLGLLFAKYIKAYLFKPVPVALAFIIGGIIILLVERRAPAARVATTRDMTWLDALKVGCAQCVAMIPGTSRSGATIIGGMLFGLSRKTATEFSFFLGVPTLMAAGAYDLWKSRDDLSVSDLPMWGIGVIVSFIAAFVVIRWLIRYVANHDFRPFAWYRIAFGAVVLITAYTGLVEWKV